MPNGQHYRVTSQCGTPLQHGTIFTLVFGFITYLLVKQRPSRTTIQCVSHALFVQVYALLRRFRRKVAAMDITTASPLTTGRMQTQQQDRAGPGRRSTGAALPYREQAEQGLAPAEAGREGARASQTGFG